MPSHPPGRPPRSAVPPEARSGTRSTAAVAVALVMALSYPAASAAVAAGGSPAAPGVNVERDLRKVPGIQFPLVASSASVVDRDGPAARVPFVPDWSWPLDPVPKALRMFEKPPRPWQRGHRGVDLAVTSPTASDGSGAPILSPADGVISFSGTVVDRGVLSIDHGAGRVSSFEPVTTDLVKGQLVDERDIIGTLADTTAATGPWHCASPCVHWGVRVDGDYVDPLGFVMDRRPSVLLPLDGGP